MKILSIQVRNFECLEGQWAFGRVTEFRGKNGSGKSALGRAIGWCLTGLDAFGDRRTDHVLRDGKKAASVKLTLEDGRVLERTKTLTGSTFTVDGLPGQADMFGDPHLVLSSFFPGYFQALDEKDKRALFMALLPPVDMASLFEKKTGLDLAKQQAMGIDFSQDPAKLHKRWAETRLTKQKELQQLKGGESELDLRVQELERQLKDHQAQGKAQVQDLAALEERGKKLSDALDTLKKKRARLMDWRTHDYRCKARSEERARLQKELDEALGGLTLAQLDAQRESVFEKLSAIRNIHDEHEAWKARLQALQHAESGQADKLSALDSGTCYTCGCGLVKGEAERLRKVLLADVPMPGEEPVCVKDAEIQAVSADLDSLRQRVGMAQKLDAMLKARPELEEERPEPEAVDQDALEEAESALRDCRVQYSAAKAAQEIKSENMTRELDKARLDLKANLDLQKEVDGHVSRLQAVEEALHPARGVWVEALEWQLDTVRELLPQWEFELSEMTKTTGNSRPCFREYLKVTDTRDPGAYHVVPLRYCSAGQQLRADLDLCRVLDKLNNDRLGFVFVDNRELLSIPPMEDGDAEQVFVALVDNSPLEVKVVQE